MNYKLSDDIGVLKLPKEVNPIEALAFYTWYDIKTIGDFLKYGNEVRKEKIFVEIVERFKRIKLKFDDELTEEELKERNREREQIKMSIRKKDERINAFLEKSIDRLSISQTIISRLKGIGIETIRQLIDTSNYAYIYINFNEADIRRIKAALSKYKISLNMLRPGEKFGEESLTEEEPEEISETKTEEVIVSEVLEEVEVPRLIPDKKVPRKNQSWEKHFEYLAAFSRYFGHTYIPESLSEEGIGRWIMNTRAHFKQGKLTEERIEKLEALGMIWKGVLGSKNKEKFLATLNIIDVCVENGVLITYYADGTIKTTEDEEFREILKNIREGVIPAIPEEKVDETPETATEEYIEPKIQYDDTESEYAIESAEEITDIEIPEDTHIETVTAYSSISTSELETRIREIKTQTEQLAAENERKRMLIIEYKKAQEEYQKQIKISQELDEKLAAVNELENLKENNKGQL